jgi:murein DD-endopeptidase MepM/ murein hydrolase activator NlpD
VRDRPRRAQARPASGPSAGKSPPPGRSRRQLVALGIIVAAAFLTVVGLSGLRGGGSASTATPSATAGASGAGIIGTLATSTALPSTSPTSTPSPLSSASPSTSPSAPLATGTPGPVAPTSAVGFALRKTVIDIAFPFRATVRYRYSDRFLAPRVGITRRFNHARGISASGRLLRAHDGVDLRAKRGTRVYAAFSGTVIDPATRWKPWEVPRYGNFVAIVSDEPTSPGYAVIYAHLASAAVDIGDHVGRGQWIGRVGNTGNAASEPPQLHVELRAPFRIPVREGGRHRRIDAFDPLPSLLAADPKRHD